MEDLSKYNPEGSDLRLAQKRMLEMLDIFVQLCEKHKIEYWLFAGTVLGARRHKGFIPWDDDLDVIILRKDHDKLMHILKNELPENLKLQNRKTDKNYKLFYNKIRDINSVYYEPGCEKYKYNGVFIDIFSIEKVPSVNLKKRVDSILNSPAVYRSKSSGKQKIRYALLMLFIPFANLIVFLSRLFYDKKDKGIYQYAYGIRDYNLSDLSLFYPISKMEFEGKKYNVPGDTDGYLKHHYGPNFMIIPDKDKRRTHADKIEVY